MGFTPEFVFAAETLPYTDQILTGCVFLLVVLSLFGLFKYYWETLQTHGLLLSLSLAVFLFLVSSGYFFSTMDSSHFLLSFLLSVILSLGILHPTLALTNIVAFLILRPWELLPLEEGLKFLPRGLFVIFVISFLFHSLRTGSFKVKWNKSYLLLILIGAWVFFSTFVTGRIGEAQSEFFDGYFRSLVVGLLILLGVQNEADNKMIQRSITIAALSLCLFALLKTFVFDFDRLEGQGAIQNANDLAAILIMVVPLAMSAFLQHPAHRRTWLPSALLVGIAALGIWKAQSRAAYLSLVAMALAWFIWHFRRNTKILVMMVLCGILSAGILSQLTLGRDSTDLQESSMNRMGYWKAGISMALRHPVFGVGFGDFSNNYTQYGAADFTESGQRTAHSSWILLLSEAGFPALFFMLLFSVTLLKRAWALAPSRPEFLLSLVGYGISMSFLSHVYTIYPYLLAGLILSCPLPSHHEVHT